MVKGIFNHKYTATVTAIRNDRSSRHPFSAAPLFLSAKPFSSIVPHHEGPKAYEKLQSREAPRLQARERRANGR